MSNKSLHFIAYQLSVLPVSDFVSLALTTTEIDFNHALVFFFETGQVISNKIKRDLLHMNVFVY